MARPTGIQSEMSLHAVQHRVGDNGNNHLDNLRIFKSGTFTDMFGFEHTWDDLHLEQMVQHFHLLRDGGYFPNVPIRSDHSMSVKDVVGYFTDIYRDPDDDQFLASSIEFTEPDAWEKWERGTWRSRSIEIGMYETNDGRAFWPVVMGLAFVDIPAVEGLHARQKPQFSFSTYVTDNEETAVSVPDITKDPQAWINAVNYAAWEQAANYAQQCENWEKAVNYAHALEQEAAQQGGEQPSITGNSTSGGQGTGSEQPPANHAQAPAQPPQMMTFRVNGQPTSDFASIQAHIDVLEQYRSESMKSGRQAYVEELARDNKIVATQIESLAAHAQSLTDEQFATFRAMYDNAPAIPGLGQHFGHEHNTTNQPPVQEGAAALDEIETAKEVVAQFRRAGMDAEKIKKTPSYRKLVSAGIETN